MDTRLKTLIEVRGLSRKQMAKDLGIERRTLDNYINEYTQMNSEMIKRISNYLNVSTDYLLNAKTADDFFLRDKVDKISEDVKELLCYLIATKK